MRERLRRLIGARSSYQPFEVAAWVVALVLLITVTRTNQILARNSFFLLAHDTSPRTLILLWIGVVALALLALTGGLWILRRTTSDVTFDRVATLLTFAVGLIVLASALGWVGGAVAAAVVALVARRIVFGKVVLVIAVVTAMVPLVSLSPDRGNEYAARQVEVMDSVERPDVLWLLPDRLQYQLIFDANGQVRPQFPALRSLQESSTTYTRAYATANGTEMSLPSMLNGVADVPTDRGQMQSLQESPGLASWLSSVYDVSVDSAIFSSLCTSPQCSQGPSESGVQALGALGADVVAVAGRTLPAPIAAEFPELDGRWRNFWAEQPEAGVEPGEEGSMTAAAFDGGRERPQFALWHSLTTHDPYNRDFDAQPIFGTWLPPEAGAWYNYAGSTPNPTSERLSRRLYLAAAVEYDRQVGRFLDRMRKNGSFDRTMIVLNSDHGRAFTASGDSRIGDDASQMWNEVAHVPLMVKMPGQTQEEFDTQVRSTAQIAATILQAAQVQVSQGPAIAAELSEPLPAAPSFLIGLGAEEPRREAWLADLTPSDMWTSADLSAASSDYPFAVTDPDLQSGQPLAGQWRSYSPTRLIPVDGESTVHLMTVEDADRQCRPESERAVVSLDGRVVAQVIWDETRQAPTDRTRGWAVVPKAAEQDYDFWCQPTRGSS
jgi:hypothetical protein